jgi:methyl-accepting chemotaxis protein
MIATRSDIAAAVAGGDSPAVQRMAKEIMRETGIALITISDAKGTVVGRGHSDQTGDSVAKQINVTKALAGQTTVGLEEGTAVKFSLRAGSPIRQDGKIVGAVTAGMNLSSSTDFVDSIKNMLGVECTIFHGDTRVTTTIEKDGKRAVGTKMDNPAVLEAVLAKGGSFFNINKIIGRDYNTAYWPIVGADGKTGGMLFIGKDRASIEQANERITTSVCISAGVVGLITVLLGYLFALATVRPMKAVMAFARQVASGDLNARAEGRFSGEMEELKGVIETMVASLREKIGEAQAMHTEAVNEAEKARRAMAEAEVARQAADVARREGILHAAEKLGAIVERVTSSSEQLSAQVEEIRVGAQVQQGRVQETVTAIEQMTATVLDVARNAAQAAGSSENTRAKAMDGAKSVEDTVKGIERVASVASELRTDMHHLGKLTDSIGQVMQVIDDIADQTNLLALNAAIEAARAGDAGRGFAVVADEVRKLAEKTMTATKEVGENIRSIQTAVGRNISQVDAAAETIAATNGLSGESGKVLGQIVTLAEGSYSEVQSIAAASEEQSSASEEISRAMGEINLIASKTYQGMHESAEAVRDLAKLAVELNGLLQEMRSM